MVLPGPLHDSKKNIFQILCGSCFQYECHYINTSGTTDNSIFVNEGRFLLKAVVQDTILDTIHSSKVHEVKQGYDNLHEPSSQEFKIQNQNSKSKKCPPGVATYNYSFKGHVHKYGRDLFHCRVQEKVKFWIRIFIL